VNDTFATLSGLLQSDYDTNVGYMDGQHQAVIRRAGASPAEQAEQLRSLENKARKWAKKFLHKVKQAAARAETQAGEVVPVGQRPLGEGGSGRPTKGTPLDTIDSVPSPPTEAASANLSKHSPHVVSPQRTSRTASSGAAGNSSKPSKPRVSGAGTNPQKASATVSKAEEKQQRAARRQQLQEQQEAEVRQHAIAEERQRRAKEQARREQQQQEQQQQQLQRQRQGEESARSVWVWHTLYALRSAGNSNPFHTAPPIT
jgi:hypothetical protein